MKTCCQTSEVYVSPGDVDRIAAHTGRTDFHEFRPAGDPMYVEQDDDPAWLEHVFRPDGTRRIMKRRPDGDCTFLGAQGCELPLEIRPLICRLYPYDYDERGIRDDLVHGCPLELLPPQQGLIEALDMNIEDARRWHRQLYREIRLEPRDDDAGTLCFRRRRIEGRSVITPMKVGITYDLRDDYLAEGLDDLETAEFDRIETIDAIDEALRALGHATDRIGRARQLVNRLACGERWGLVFNICEGLHGVGREAQVPTLLDLYDIDYTFADPGAMIACLHKGFAKTLVARAGLPTADFAIIETLADLEAGTPLQEFPLFVKPVAEGTGKGVSPASIVHDSSALVATCTALLSAHRQPVLVERYLPGASSPSAFSAPGAVPARWARWRSSSATRRRPERIRTRTRSTGKSACPTATTVPRAALRATPPSSRSRRSPCGRGACSAAGMAAGSMCAATAAVSPISWRSTRWRASIRPIRTCP